MKMSKSVILTSGSQACVKMLLNETLDILIKLNKYIEWLMQDLKSFSTKFNKKLKSVTLTCISHAWMEVLQNKNLDQYLSSFQTSAHLNKHINLNKELKNSNTELQDMGRLSCRIKLWTISTQLNQQFELCRDLKNFTAKL